MLAQITFGKEVFDNASATYGALVARTTAFPAMQEPERQLWMVAKEGLFSAERVGGLDITPAVPGHNDKMGKWTTASYNLPEGMLVVFYGSRKLAAQVSGRHTNARVILRIREGAGLIRLTGQLTADPRTPNTKTLFEGRADILSPSVARAEGMMMRGSQAAYAPENVQVLFDATELAPMIHQVPTVREETVLNSDGQEVRVQSSEPRRIIEV